MADDLNAMAMFVTVAEAKGFRAAGDSIGVSASAVSQSIRKIEEQLGVVRKKIEKGALERAREKGRAGKSARERAREEGRVRERFLSRAGIPSLIRE